ncbi:nucleotide sugar dehydrogenase [Pelagibacteraceae bacterium]|nr:nucleotide sugar dehydrogenase [Pelagibacteraceae bacterium]
MNNKRNISIIGGAGHVGFALGLVFSSKGFKVSLIDKNKENIKKINSGQIPFLEEKSQKLLKKMISKNKIYATAELKEVVKSKYIIICIGTPITTRLNPDLRSFISFFYQLKKFLKKDHIIIIRSSIYPGICNKIFKIIKSKCNNLSYCPERIVQGKSILELPKLPQLVSGKNKKAILESGKLFEKISKKIINTEVIEAELVKLFSNAYRYINFSISNQFYMLCQNQNLDFFKIRNIMRDGYMRNANIPMSGFTSGPCLLKDTMQLSAFYDHKFSLGKTAMSINEGLPKFILNKIEKKYKLKNKIVGVLGLAFKSETDDIRDSLSIKLLQLLKSKKIKTLQSDEFYKNKNNVDKKYLVKKSDIIILSTPHKAYKKLRIGKSKILIDAWGLIDQN